VHPESLSSNGSTSFPLYALHLTYLFFQLCDIYFFFFPTFFFSPPFAVSARCHDPSALLVRQRFSANIAHSFFLTTMLGCGFPPPPSLQGSLFRTLMLAPEFLRSFECWHALPPLTLSHIALYSTRAIFLFPLLQSGFFFKLFGFFLYAYFFWGSLFTQLSLMRIFVCILGTFSSSCFLFLF